jgi:hypothetical protein
VSLIPTISISSHNLSVPFSILQVTTVPLHLIENTSSIGIIKGKSTGLSGTGTNASTASIRSIIDFAQYGFSKSVGFSRVTRADHLIIGVVSHGKDCFVNKSLISASTRSNISESFTMSHLFIYTTI